MRKLINLYNDIVKSRGLYETSLSQDESSVANAAVYPSNWACLPRVKNCWAGGLQIGLLFIHLPEAALFLQICQFLVNSESF